MTPTPVKPAHFTVSPTVKEIYTEGEEEFIAAGEIPQMTLLSNENDSVTGLESIYGTILREHQRKLPISSVTGNESFMESVKSGFNKMIQAVKDFFKWLWSFFGGKQKAVEDKLVKVKLALEKSGAKSGEVGYPTVAAYIYKKAGKPDNNLAWVKEALEDIVKTTDKAILYVKDTGKLMESVTNASGSSALTAMSSLPKELSKNFLTVFGLEEDKPGFLLMGTDIMFRDGRASEIGQAEKVKRFYGAKFVTTTTELTGYMKDTDTIKTKLEEFGKDLFNLEQTFIKNLQKAIDVTTKQEAADKKLTDQASTAIKESIRNTMANLKYLQNILLRAVGSVGTVVSAATA